MDIEKETGRVAEKMFSICIGKNGGALSFGSWNDDLHLSEKETHTIDCSDMSWGKRFEMKLDRIKVV